MGFVLACGVVVLRTMLDAAAADGVRHLFATSHSTPGMERFPQEIYDRHLAFARDYCAQKGYDLKLECGSELLYTPAAGYAAAQHQLLTLGDTDWVLLEFVLNITAKELEAALREITGAGYRILVAHIERYPCLAPLSASCFMKKLMGKERPFVKKCGVSVFLRKKTCVSKDKVLN